MEQMDNTQLEMLSRLLEKHDKAKQLLRDKGYGYTGLDILGLIELVPDQNPTDFKTQKKLL